MLPQGSTPVDGPPVVHERSYRRRGPIGFVHRSRLRSIVDVLRRHVPPSVRTWADFGCSNGFVIEEIVQEGVFDFERIVGYDHSKALLELARQKGIANTVFEEFDLNTKQTPKETFELVTCFETLEHVGDYRTAFDNICAHLGDGGVLVISVPNETGLPGLVKLAGRRVLRRSADQEFFARSHVGGRYIRCLLRNACIDGFRDPSRDGYGSHLGFDYRRLYAFVAGRFVESERLVEVSKVSTTLRMNKIAVYRRTV